MNDERRLYSRIAFHAPAQLIFANKQINVVVLDLSLKGALTARGPEARSKRSSANTRTARWRQPPNSA